MQLHFIVLRLSNDLNFLIFSDNYANFSDRLDKGVYLIVDVIFQLNLFQVPRMDMGGCEIKFEVVLY